MRSRFSSTALSAVLGIAMATAAFVACGGGGGGGGSDGGRTTIQGNLNDSTAFLLPAKPESRALAWIRRWSPVGIAWAQESGALVCIVGTDVCAPTDSSGSFLVAVDGGLNDPCLDITAQDFEARVCIDGNFPAGSLISLHDVSCSAATGTCVANDIDVDEPSDDDVSDPSVDDVSDGDLPSPGDEEPSLDDDSDNHGPDDENDVSEDDDEPDLD